MLARMDSLKINGKDVGSLFSEMVCKNNFVHETEPTRLPITFALNSREIDSAYVPTLELTFAVITAEEFRWILWEINRNDFEIEYYDYTLDAVVKRTMSIPQYDIEKLQVVANNTQLIEGFTFSTSSYFAYLSKIDLIGNNPISEV